MDEIFNTSLNSTIEKQSTWIVRNSILLSLLIIASTFYGLYLIRIPIYDKATLLITDNENGTEYTLQTNNSHYRRAKRGTVVELTFAQSENIRFTIDSIDSTDPTLRLFVSPVNIYKFDDRPTSLPVKIFKKNSRLITVLSSLK